MNAPVETPAAGAPRAVAPPRAAAGALRAELHLLSPRWLAARNRLRRMTRQGRAQLAFVALIGLAFGAAIFAFFLRVLRYFLAVPDFGPVLTYKLLGMVFMTFFSILLFSNIVAALSTFFLSKDLDRLVAAPIERGRFFRARFIETMLDSSWMILLFALPAFLAYGVAHQAGAAFYLAVVATLLPFLTIPAALGIVITFVLVNVFPARRTKDIMVFLSIVVVAGLYVLFRMLRPERLVNPESFSDFVEFVTAMRAPSAPYLPSSWAVEVLYPLLHGSPATSVDASVVVPESHALFYYLLLLTTAGVTYMLGEAVAARWFLSGWSKAQEGRRARLTRAALWERGLALALAPFALQTRLLLAKELKTFFRDTSQWSQLFLLLALVVVYVYNFSVLPLNGSPLVTFYFKNVIAFVNLALAAFVAAAVAVRFVFPSISLEGKAFWILKTAPLDLRRVWWAKFCTGFLPLFVLGQILVVLTNSYLQVMTQIMWLSSVTLGLMTFGIVSLGLAVGAAYPRFDADNAARVAAGPGGLIYMVLCVSFIGAVVVLEAWPVYVLFTHHLRGTSLTLFELGGVVASLATVVLLCTGVFAVSLRRGMRRLAAIEP